MAERKKMNEALDWIIHIAIAILIGVLIVTYVGQRTIVHDISMQPTLVEGNNLIVEKLTARFGGLHKGDIVVFYEPSAKKQLIKRLIAVAGDKIEIKDGKIYVNGVADNISNRPGVPTDTEDPKYDSLVVPKGHVFVLGDNRPSSMDSRTFGPVDMKQMVGRAVLRVYPFDKFGKLPK